ncbi:hypothetical protein AAVH_38566, partial [Aphelenchoides avenae]
MAEDDTGLFYERYKDRGLIAAAVPPVALILSVVSVGFWANCRIVYVTLRSGSLRGTCNLLIALCSLSDLMHMPSQAFLGYLVFSGRNFVALRTCYWVMFVPLAGLVFGQTLIFLIGVDRLLCAVAPQRSPAALI